MCVCEGYPGIEEELTSYYTICPTNQMLNMQTFYKLNWNMDIPPWSIKD